MKIPYLLLVAASVVALAGCGQKESAAAPGAGPKTFALTASDTMKYNVTRLEVSPGEEVRVTLTNVGTQPKAAMGHNWTLLKQGADAAAFANAAVLHKDSDYFPADLAGEVIAHTKLLGPRQSDTVEFKAPTEPGEYPFLCTFPGHFVSGMKGVLVVK
jgi:azurin